jgi:UDP:flavonoid glycosyltransferase YjiC (YdhE family)
VKTIIFAPATYNLSETTRTLEIAKACSDSFSPVFIGYGGTYSYLIEEAGVPLRTLEPVLTDEKIRHLLEIDRMEKRGDFYTESELEQRVANEISVLEELKPEAVVTGFNLSVIISARAAGVPLVWEIAAAGVRPYYEAGLSTWPDAFDSPYLRWIPEGWLNWANNNLLVRSKMMVGPINKVARAYRVPEFKSFLYVAEGDYTLLTDVPEMTGITDLPMGFRYVGPFIARLDLPVPPEITDMPRDKPVVYFGMGSSGSPELTRAIVEGFRGKPYRVIAPVKHRLQQLKANVPDNVVVTDLVPAHRVNPMADISLIHGGAGTVYTACLAGKPIVGIGFQPEQEGNLECLARKGFAIRLRRRRVTPEAIFEALETLLADPDAIRKAEEFKKIVESWDGPTNAADFLRKTFG